MKTNSQQEEHHPEQPRPYHYYKCEVHPSTYRKGLALTLPSIKRTILKHSNYTFLTLLSWVRVYMSSFQASTIRMQIYTWELFSKTAPELRVISLSQIETQCHLDMLCWGRTHRNRAWEHRFRKHSSNSKAISKMPQISLHPGQVMLDFFSQALVVACPSMVDG